MVTFNEFLSEELLLEMPHIDIGGGNVVDLELEFHSKMDPKLFLDYMKKWLNGEPIDHKNKGFNGEVNKSNVKEFATKALKNDFIKFFVIKHYGEPVWKSIQSLLRSRIE